ncbi:DUF6941 family protein [Pedosphaera parvula]|uniref:Uncharacterized protein n=1 Tax=Pedosphaera parvula (strain Ellin514) TaxID=320771 RepID=B9XH00_PEDPL|nr:hypothetical protein [Pedosphaera parvula]EEF60921.1 hypothetical protein Cflav_PD4090 [Pedosphaera parvula Ellin514]
MNIQVAVLCDAATDSGGKLNILGAFDGLNPPQFPFVYAQCCIALRLTFTSEEEGTHQLRLTFMDEDGKMLMPGIDLPIAVAIPAESHFATSNVIVVHPPLKFEKAGLYSVDISLDGRQQGSIPLLVRGTRQG